MPNIYMFLNGKEYNLQFFVHLLILSIGFLIAAWYTTKRYLHFFQQEEYDNRRFFLWLINTLSIEKRVNLALLVLIVIFLGSSYSLYKYFYGYFEIVFSVGTAIVIGFLGWTNQVKSTKKALVMTARANRLIYTALFIGLFAFYICNLILYSPYWAGYPIVPYYSLFVAFLLIPIYLILANLLLSPYESITQRRFLSEAKEILAKHSPKIIGITGSFGKTSIKHILSHILNSFAPTLATPGSVNTKMGITRIIREQLRSEHQYFIVEMGAYGIGSIQRLCDFTPPQVGIVTAVGLAHLERFRSVETVAKAKSELPRALPTDGVAILNGDNLYCREMANAISCPAYFYGSDTALGPLHCRLVSDEITEQGTCITFEYNGQTQSVTMPVYGKHQALNAAGAILAALKIGVPMLNVLAALQTLSQIPHRLVVQKGADGITMIDDAYNSNPDGFKSALEVLKTLPGQRKILVTPGMVELGIRHDEEHRRIGKIAAASCDYVLLVVSHRIQAMKEGLLESGFPRENCLEFPTLQAARGWMEKELKAGDVVLFENDLPDLYEVQTAFRLF